jgi:hypothetical protein
VIALAASILGAALPLMGELQTLLGLAALLIHEPGHMLFAPLGEFISVLGGTLTELGAPLLLAALALWRRNSALFWASAALFGFTLADVARYMADARAQQLPLWGSLGLNDGDVIHDWRYLFQELGLLEYDAAISKWVRGAAVLAMFAGALGLITAPERLLARRQKS